MEGCVWYMWYQIAVCGHWTPHATADAAECTDASASMCTEGCAVRGQGCPMNVAGKQIVIFGDVVSGDDFWGRGVR